MSKPQVAKQRTCDDVIHRALACLVLLTPPRQAPGESTATFFFFAQDDLRAQPVARSFASHSIVALHNSFQARILLEAFVEGVERRTLNFADL